jgi:DsbC/DsbD-like thiol-disulfide interchange protein
MTAQILFSSVTAVGLLVSTRGQEPSPQKSSQTQSSQTQAPSGTAQPPVPAPLKRPGLSLQLVPEVERVIPGQKFALGLILKHDPGYHTYWKQPGIVGLPSRVEWKLPEGWKAGEVLFPRPERTKMAKWGCWGYEREICLVAEITPSEAIPASTTSVTLEAAYSGMCCAQTCHPTSEKLPLTLAVDHAVQAKPQATSWAPLFAITRQEQPLPPPAGWKITAQRTPTEISLKLQPPAGQSVPPDVFFFGLDLLIDSHEPQTIAPHPDGSTTVTGKICEMPAEVPQLRGWLHSEKGLPGAKHGWGIEVPLAKVSAK